MEQQIGFCTASDGVKIAYATIGTGPPLVYASGLATHLELEWERPFVRAFLEALAEGPTLVRYDMRGSGLSDRDVRDFSLDVLVHDLGAVADHLKLGQFPLMSLGGVAGPIAITYAAAHPERVSHLILCGAYARGSEITTPDRAQTYVDYVSKFGPPLDFALQPGIDADELQDIIQRQRSAMSREAQAEVLKTMFAADVSECLDKLSMPVLVMHGHRDRAVRFDLGRELAAQLPQAKFVPFEGSSATPLTISHIIIPEIHSFLGIEVKQATLRGSAPELVIILFTDIEGSTALGQSFGDAKAQEVRRAHNGVVRDALGTHGGTEIKHTGDGIMASFPSASGALECAISIQRAVSEHAHPNLKVHVGLNAGEPIAEERDLFGTAVDLARRICDQARGGEILASDVVRQLVAGKGFLFADRGETALRGFEDPVRLYEVHWEA